MLCGAWRSLAVRGRQSVVAQRRWNSQSLEESDITLTIPPRWLSNRLCYAGAQVLLAMHIDPDFKVSTVPAKFDDFVWAFASVANLFATGNGQAIRNVCVPGFVQALEASALIPDAPPPPGSPLEHGLELGPIAITPLYLELHFSFESRSFRPQRVEFGAAFSFDYPDADGQRKPIAAPLQAIFRGEDGAFKVQHIDFLSDAAREFWRAIWPDPVQRSVFLMR